MWSSSALKLAAFLVVLSATQTTCGRREEAITRGSLSFMVKDRGTRVGREAEILELARLGAFRESMSRDELKVTLGEPDSIWDDIPEAMREKLGCDQRYVYRLGPTSSLSADFVDGKLKSVHRRVER